MRLILMLALFVLAVSAAPPPQEVTILNYESDSDGYGRYNFAFETSDGTKRQEQSELVHAGEGDREALIVRGSFSYVGPDGVTYSVTYIADEDGFHPQGAHLPALPASSEGAGDSDYEDAVKPEVLGLSAGLVGSLLG